MQILCSPQSLKYLLSDSMQKMFADLYYRQCDMTFHKKDSLPKVIVTIGSDSHLRMGVEKIE